MSFNARIDLKSDGVHAFSNRLPHILAFIQDQSPDVIGFQELSPSMLDALKQGLDDYVAIGEPRDAKGEANPLFIKRDNSLYETKTIWYSGKKHVAQTGAHFPRTFTVVTFVHQTQPMTVMNTHLSHVSDLARKDAIHTLVAYVKKHAHTMPLVLMGDFNTIPSEGLLNPLDMLLQSVWHRQTLNPTFHGFTAPTMTEPIDHIYYSDHWQAQGFKVHDHPNEATLSDHYPIQVTLALKNC